MKNSLLILSLLSIVVIVLVGFAIFVPYQKNSTNKYEKEITRIETTSDSDEVDLIKEDLDETDLDNIDTELTQIEAELN